MGRYGLTLTTSKLYQVFKMVQYKITYFNSRGIAEMSRLILTYAKQPFEDIRIEKDGWEKIKENYPFAQLPVLEVDGKKIAQSNAMARYLARKYKLAGKDDLEAAYVDSIADYQKDILAELFPFFGVMSGRVKGDKEASKKDVLIPVLEKSMPVFEKMLKEGGGFFAKSGVTWVDFFVSEFWLTLSTLAPDAFTKYKFALDYVKRVHSIPQIKDYIAKRPETQF